MNIPSLWRRNSGEHFRMLNRIQNDFERLFHELGSVEPRFMASDFSPSCELSEDKTNYIIKFDIPGVKKDDIKIELNGNQLIVSAERREETKSEDKKSRYSEITYGSFQRSLSLPSSVDDKNVDAKFDNGVLTLTLPKTALPQAKQIDIH